MIRNRPQSDNAATPPARVIRDVARTLRPPIQRKRRALVAICLLPLAAPYLIYAYVTNESFINRQATQALEQATGGLVQIDDASFSLFTGIRLGRVTISTPYDETFYTTNDRVIRNELFRADSVELIHDPWSLLAGSLRVREIIATEPAFNIVYNADTDRYNWSLLFTGDGPPQEKKVPQRPRISLRNASVTLHRIDSGERARSVSYRLDADAWPDAASTTSYDIDYRIYGQSAHRVRGRYDPHEGRVRNTPFIDYASIRTVLPTEYRRFLDRFRLAGRFRLERMDLEESDPGRREIRLEFKDASCDLRMPFHAPDEPLTETSAAYTPLSLTSLEGAITLTGRTLVLSLQGKLNGAVARLDGTIGNIDLPTDQLAMDVRLTCKGFRLPEGAIRESLLGDETVPGKLRAFLVDFDPYGTIDLDGRITRKNGPDQPLEYVGALVATGDVSASYRIFPYRVSHLSGALRIAPDGILFDDFVGQHGMGQVRVNGRVEQPVWWTDFDFTVSTTHLPINAELYGALQPHHQRVFARINPRGWIDIGLHVYRHGGQPDNPARWVTTADINFDNLRVKLDAVPYELTDMYGNVFITGSRIEWNGVHARHEDASLRFDGWMNLFKEREDHLELRIEANSLPLDDALWQALSPRMADNARASGITGRINMLGRYTLDDQDPSGRFDMQGIWRDGQYRLEAMPVAVTDVNGAFHFTDTMLQMRHIRGVHAGAPITLSGDLTFDGPTTDGDVIFTARDLALTDELRGDLPTGIQRVWQEFQPRGNIDVDTFVRFRGGQSGRNPRHRTAITFKDAQLLWEALPVPVEHVNGRVVVDDDRFDIETLEGQLADLEVAGAPSTFAISGTVDTATEDMRGDVSLAVHNIPMADSRMRSRLPEAARRLLESIAVVGVADLEFDQISLNSNADIPLWTIDGRMTLHDAAMNLGIRFDRLSADISARSEFTNNRIESLIGTITAPSFRAGGWDVSEVHGTLAVSKNGRRLELHDVTGRMLDGDVTGSAEVQIGVEKPRYNYSVTLINSDFTMFASQLLAPGAESVAKGRMFANLSATGITGNDASREGRGEIMLREAQLFKLPVVLAILQVLQLTPDDQAFDEASVQFVIMGNRLRLTRVDLRGRSLSLLGTGTFDISTRRLDISLAAATPKAMRVPILTQLLEDAGRELMEVTVTGTIDQPRVTAQPFRSVRNFLEELIGPAAMP